MACASTRRDWRRRGSVESRHAAPLLQLGDRMTHPGARGPHEAPRSIAAAGLRFAYVESGTGPLVLLFHGFPDDAYTFDELREALADADYRAVAPFLRGYHPSDIPPDGDYSPLTLGRDVLALMDAFGEANAFVVGHDWGAIAGYVAASLAPQRVRRLVVMGMPHARALRPTPRQMWGARHFLYCAMPWAPRAVRRRRLAYIDRLYRRMSPHWTAPAEQVERITAALALPGRLEAALDYYHDVLPSLLRPSSRRVLLRRTAVPTLAIAGCEDPGVPPSSITEAGRCFTAGYRPQVVAGAGHFVHCQRPAEVNAAILAWLGTPG